MAGIMEGRQKGKAKERPKATQLAGTKEKGRELIPLMVSIVKMQVWAEMASPFVIDAWHNNRGKNL